MKLILRIDGTGAARLPPGLSLPCESHSGYDVQYIPHFLCRSHDWLIDACRHEHVRIVHSCIKRDGPVSIVFVHTVTDGIKDHKLVLVAGTKPLDCDNRNQHQSRDSVATRRIRVVIIHDIKPVVDGGAATAPDHVEACPDDVSKLSAALMEYSSEPVKG
jgi:hypothetical protein